MYWINIYFRQLQYDFEAQEQTSISITESHSKFLMQYIVHLITTHYNERMSTNKHLYLASLNSIIYII